MKCNGPISDNKNELKKYYEIFFRVECSFEKVVLTWNRHTVTGLLPFAKEVSNSKCLLRDLKKKWMLPYNCVPRYIEFEKVEIKLVGIH